MRSRRVAFLILAIIGSCFANGCLAKQAAADGRGFRHALVDMYTDQTMDNLVSAANDRPFVQMAYRNLLVTDTLTVKGNVGNELAPANAKSVTQTALSLLTISHGYVDKLVFGAGATSDRQMAFKSDPVTGKRDVYDLYSAFAKDPGLFQSSVEDPGCAAHIKRKCGDLWYWVPVDAAPVFLQLVMRTTFMLGPEKPPTIYHSTTVAEVAPAYGPDGEKTDKFVVYFVTAIPNDSGFMEVTLADGKKVKVDLVLAGLKPYLPNVMKQEDQHAPRRGFDTQYLYSSAAEVFKLHDPELFKGRPARVYLNDNPNLGKRSDVDKRLDEALANYRRSR